VSTLFEAAVMAYLLGMQLALRLLWLSWHGAL
jgi:hypothetical protein